MSAERVRITVRVTPQQRVVISAAARRLGMAVNDFVAARALERAEQDAAIQQVFERMGEFEASLAGVLDAVHSGLKNDFAEAVSSLANSIQEQGVAQASNLKKLSEYVRSAASQMAQRS